MQDKRATINWANLPLPRMHFTTAILYIIFLMFILLQKCT